MRIAIWAASTALALMPVLAQAQHAPADTKAAGAARATRPAPVVPNVSAAQQNTYQQNQAAAQGAYQDNVTSQQRMQTLNQRNQQMMQSQPAPVQSLPR